MLDRARREILAILKVPPEPRPPEGTPESILIFRAGHNFYRWLILAWIVAHIGLVVGALSGYYWVGRWLDASFGQWVQWFYHASEILGLAGAAVALPFTFLALKLNYELRWYIVTDRSLRIRRGVWSVEELTMTFANVQEIRVTSGPIQNLLGLADVEVHSAGGGGTAGPGEPKGHVATFEGVDHANDLRDLLVERLRLYRDLGLGDATHRTTAPAESSQGALAAACILLDEARALRGVFPAGLQP